MIQPPYPETHIEMILPQKTLNPPFKTLTSVLHKHQTEKCFPNAEIAGKLLTNRLFIKLKYNIPKHLQIGDLQKSIKPANNCRNVGWVDTK